VGTESDVDVVVIGSGAAGLAAAVSAHEQGAQRILVAEAENVVGGSSRLSGGVVMASESRLQKAAGISDDVESFWHDYMLYNQYDVELGPVRTLTHRAGETIDWLEDRGVPFADSLIYCGVEENQRGHLVHGGGQGLIDALHSHCRRNGIDIALGQRVDPLLTSDGVIRGVAVGDDVITTSAVVVASGGFGADLGKVAQYFPSVYSEGWTWYIGADGSRGDALEFANEVGAQTVGLDHGLRTVAPQFFPNRFNEAFQPGWCALLAGNGRRFMDESQPYAVVDARMHAIGDRAYMVFDDNAMRPPADLADQYFSPYRQVWPTHAPFRPKNYVVDLVEEMVGNGRAHKADSIEALAAAAGLPASSVAAELERYNRFCADGEDTDLLKPAKFLLPIAKAPFYLIEVRPCTLNWSGYGLRTDAQCRVLHDNGHEIAGLYAAGECTGGVLGPAYLGSGNSLANSCTMGRVAGEAAAAYSLDKARQGSSA
jgi:flavocytochrome c